MVQYRSMMPARGTPPTIKAEKRKGEIISIGGQLATTYEPTAKGAKALIKDFYNDAMRMYKAAGPAGYGTPGMFNAIMGKEITLGVFASNTVLTAIGTRAYDHEGHRIVHSLGKKGKIGTTREGPIPDPVHPPMKQIRMPYKELPFSFAYGLGLKALENKDDTSAYQEWIDIQTATYADGLDYDILANVTTPIEMMAGEEICLTPISRVIASSTEVGADYDGTTVTGEMVTPWGGVGSDMYPMRTSGTQNNFDGYVNNTAGSLSLDDFNNLYSGCALYWKDQMNPNNKMFGMSIVALEKMGQLLQVNNCNIWLESVFIQKDFNGVKTAPGRELGGMLGSAYRGIPILIDGNYNYDLVTDRVGNGLGEVHLLDLDNLYLSLLTPVEFRSTDDYAITRKLQEDSVMQSRMELRADKFLGHGRITNKTA